MTTERDSFLELSHISLQLLATPEVEAAWDGPSALREMSVRALAGHLSRATTSVDRYLDRPEPDDPPIRAGTYFATAVPDDDIFSEVNTSVRDTGEQEAGAGHAALVVRLDEAILRLEARLAAEPPERKVRVFQDLVLVLDEYLRTRIVELAVHIDDLAVSAGIETPPLPEPATEIAMNTMLEVALERHGGLSVVRAMARRERDDRGALRVF